MTITGIIPSAIANFLKTEDESLNRIEIKGNDIDVILTDKGIYTELYGVGMGNGSYEIIEIDDNLNLLPEYSEGDVISNDVLKKIFYTVINSSLILSFNPLGKVKYGIKDVAGRVKDAATSVGKAIGDWALDKVDADQAEKAIRKLGKVKTTFMDKRDGKKKRGDFSTTGVNVGKIESLGKMGHYKVLTGNPATQDFQVFHLYRNGNKYRVLDAKTGLEAEEAKWVYDNNLPKNYTEADWKNAGDNDFMNQLDENDVQETEEVEQYEEDNVTDEIGDPDDWWDAENTGTTEEDNVTEIKRNSKVKQNVKSSVDSEEDNVIESKPKKKKSKYNGCNVTGCVEADGSVALASFIRQNLVDFHNHMKGQNITGESKEQLDAVMKKLKELLNVDPKLVSEMTKQSTGNLTIDFSVVPDANMKYVITLDFTENGVQISGSGLPKENRLEFTLDCLNKVIKTIAGV